MGQFVAQDDKGMSVILEWSQTDILSPDLATFKKEVCEIASDTLAPIEVQFLRVHPYAVSQELFLKPCAPLFEKGLEFVNWKMVEEMIASTIKQFYLADLSKFGTEIIKPLLKDIYFSMKVRDKKTEKILGFLICAITPALPKGDVKIINLVILPTEQSRGLDKLLLNLVLKIIPGIKRLFIFIRPTNDHDLKRYRSLGFTQNLNPIQDPNHKVNMEFLTLMEYNQLD